MVEYQSNTTSTNIIQYPDMSMFNLRDVADIALQRTGGLIRLPLLGSIAYKMWVNNYEQPLLFESRIRRKKIIENAFTELKREFEVICKYINNRKIDQMADIGCGHGLVDLLFYRRYECNIHLIDIESTDEKHHDYAQSGAGYGSLSKARSYLTQNGVPDQRIKTTNPKKEVLIDNNIDLIISLISAGFHYPIAEYVEFFRKSLKPNGILIFDMRNDSGQEEFLSLFPDHEIIDKGPKHKRLAVRNT